MILNNNFLENKVFNRSEYNYTQNELSAGIVHIGVGNFHRSHQAYFLDKLFNKRLNMNFGIVGAGLKEYDSLMREDLLKQDCLTSLIQRDNSSTKLRVLQSMIDFIEVDNSILVNFLIKEEIKIVSLTITEGGYFIDSYGEFNIKNQEIQDDINNIQNPKTVFGVLILALHKRKESGIKPFTLMSCDNIAHNGNVLKNILVKMSSMIDKSLCEYISNNIACPNSMVDRITPTATFEDKEFIRNTYNYIDNRPVFCEPFIQWVIEDNFCNQRPSLEKVGVTFVKNIEPYELMKIRILNGSHAIMSSLSALLNINYVHEALQNDTVKLLLDSIIYEEVIPVLKDTIDVNLQDYYNTVLNRFSNPYIKDTITRICIDNSNKQPKFIIDSIKDGIKNNINVDGLILVSAIWCRYCIGSDENNNKLEINDNKEDELRVLALKAKDKPIVFIQYKEIYGELAKNIYFATTFEKFLNSIWENGVQKTVRNFIKG
jgi:mannitol 2-dehydrogenase